MQIGPALRILTINVEGLTSSKRELLSVICGKQNIYVLCLQETHIDPEATASAYEIDNYIETKISYAAKFML